MPVGKTLRSEEMHRRFVLEYLKDLSGPQAVIRAGYSKNPESARQQSYKLLAMPDVQTLIQAEFRKQRDSKVVDVARVLAEIERLALVNVKDAFDAETSELLPIGAMSDDLGRCISAFDVEELYDRMTGEKRGRVVKVKFWNKTDSLQMLAKYLRMWVEAGGSHTPPTPVDLSWANEAELRKLAEGK